MKNEEKFFTKGHIMDKLQRTLPVDLFTELRISCSIRGDIGICTTVNKIIMNWSSTPRDEENVALLLADLCKLHFSKVNSRKALGRREKDSSQEIS